MKARHLVAVMAALLPLASDASALAAGLAPPAGAGFRHRRAGNRHGVAGGDRPDGAEPFARHAGVHDGVSAHHHRAVDAASRLWHAGDSPNAALLGLSLFLTLFVMAPVAQDVNEHALQPFMQGTLSIEDAYARGAEPLRAFMVKQTREEDLALMLELSGATKPRTLEEVSNVQLIPAFMLSELRVAFQIGFVIFLPFLLIDLIVSSVLMGLGMMMMPPVTVSLPIKILLFVLIDGWGLVLRSTIGSFH